MNDGSDGNKELYLSVHECSIRVCCDRRIYAPVPSQDPFCQFLTCL